MIGNFLIFGKEVSSYAVCAFVGAMLTGTFAFIMSKRKGLDEVKMTFMLLFSVIGVFIGGHLLYGITNIDKMWLFGKIKNLNGFITVFSLIFGGQVFYGVPSDLDALKESIEDVKNARLPLIWVYRYLIKREIHNKMTKLQMQTYKKGQYCKMGIGA